MSSLIGSLKTPSTPGVNVAQVVQNDGTSPFSIRGLLGADVPLATASLQGALSATNFSNINNWFGKAVLNALDYGADPTGATDIVASVLPAMAAATPANGAQWVFPPGSYKMASAYTVAIAGVEIVGSSLNGTQFVCSSATADMFVVNQWYVAFKNLTLTTSINKTAGYAINAPQGYDYLQVDNVNISGASSSVQMFRGINFSNLIGIINGVRMIFVSDAYVLVAAASNANQYIHGLLCSNAAQCTTGGVILQSMGSLLMSDCDIVQGGPGALLINAPNAAPNTVPSLECVNCFFDTSTNGLQVNNVGTGTFVRSRFTSCWFGNNTTAGINVAAVGGGADGITFVNCDFYNNGIGFLGAAAIGNWQLLACRFGGNTTNHISFTVAGTASTLFVCSNCIFGPQAGFGNTPNAVTIAAQTTTSVYRFVGCGFTSNTVTSTNGFVISGAWTGGAVTIQDCSFVTWGTAISFTTGTYHALRIEQSLFFGNTTALTRGTVTIVGANYAQYRIADNNGLNPVQPLAQPTLAATGVATVNNTGVRCGVHATAVGTGASRTQVNGVNTGTTALAVGALLGVVDPGGSITITFTVAPTLIWVGN